MGEFVADENEREKEKERERERERENGNGLEWKRKKPASQANQPQYASMAIVGRANYIR